MSLELRPINPTRDAPRYEDGVCMSAYYTLHGWSAIKEMFKQWGIDTSTLSEYGVDNDGKEIPELTCQQITEGIEKHLDEIAREGNWARAPFDVTLWRTCGGYRQYF